VAEREGRTELAAYVRLMTAQAEEMAGQVEQALDSYRSAIDLYVGLAGQHEVVAHLRTSFLNMYRQHEVDDARRQAILARAKADAFLGDLEIMAGRYENALALLRAAEAALDQHGDDLTTRARICVYLSSVYLKTGQFDAALAAIDRAIECDRQRGDEVSPLYSRLNRAWVLKELGRLAESEREAREALRLAERVRNSYLIAGLAAGVAEACWAQEMWDEAERYAIYSMQQEEVFFRASACVVLAAVRSYQGRRAEAEQLFAAAVEHAQQIGDRLDEAYVWRERGRAALRAGGRAEAESSFARAEQLYSELGLAHELEALRLMVE
jgi:tetratricopeptide (TPR) repeat protein